MTPDGTSPSPRSYIRDGTGLVCLGIGGWGAAPIAGYPGWAIPALLIGVTLGTLTLVLGYRAARREDLLAHLADVLAPVIGATAGRARGLIDATRWTMSIPGQPRRLRIHYSHGRVKLPEATVELGDQRWANEIARQVGTRLGGTYLVTDNNAVKGKLTLRLTDPFVDDTVPETKQVLRAKKIVNELLAGTATFNKLQVDQDTGEVTRIEVKHDVGTKLVASGYRNRVERTVSAMLQDRWRAKWDLEADKVIFEVRPTLPASVWIPPLDPPDDDPLSNYREVRIPFGVDEDGEVIAWRPAVSPQWLVTGGTGSGKTSTGHGILTQISRYGWPIWIADGKGTEFLGFQDWPNVQIVASSIAEQVAVIHRAWQLMEHRYQLVVQRRARVEDFEPLMVFVDEFTDLKANLLTWYTQIKVKGDPTKPVTLSEIGSIARKGRTARVHLVLTLQRPDAEILTGEVRENFGQRTSLGPISPQGAEMMWNNPVTGVALPRGRTGRAIGTNNAGIPVEMQAYRVPDPKDVIPGTDEYELIEKLRPAESRHERLLIVPPQINWDAEEPVEPTFTDYLEADWVKAADRLDLDPLARLEGVAGEVVDGRALSSPMALFGLNDAGTPPATRKPTAAGGGMSPAPGEDLDSDEGLVDDLEGYAPATQLRVTGLQVGDLVCVDEDLGTWAVVEEEPIPDFDDDDCLVIAWRDDQDNSGQLVMPSESLLETRRPLGFDDLAA